MTSAWFLQPQQPAFTSAEEICSFAFARGRAASKWRGYQHHRWIFNIRQGVWQGYPKSVFIEHVTSFDTLTSPAWRRAYFELSFYWEHSIELHVIQNDWLGPSRFAIARIYRANLTNDDGDEWIRCLGSSSSTRCQSPILASWMDATEVAEAMMLKKSKTRIACTEK